MDNLYLPKMTPNLKQLYESGDWEREEVEFCRYLTPQSRVLEGGSGFGFLAHLFEPKVEYWLGIEPNAYLYDLCWANTCRSNFLRGILSNQDKLFYVRDDFLDSSTKPTAPYGVVIEQYVAKALDIQDLIQGYRINTLVLDIEGEESILLDCDLSLIEKIIVELHGDYLELYNYLHKLYPYCLGAVKQFTKVCLFSKETLCAG